MVLFMAIITEQFGNLQMTSLKVHLHISIHESEIHWNIALVLASCVGLEGDNASALFLLQGKNELMMVSTSLLSVWVYRHAKCGVWHMAHSNTVLGAN